MHRCRTESVILLYFGPKIRLLIFTDTLKELCDSFCDIIVHPISRLSEQ